MAPPKSYTGPIVATVVVILAACAWFIGGRALQSPEAGPAQKSIHASDVEAIPLYSGGHEVTRRLGEPHDTQTLRNESGQTDYWYYDTPEGRVQIRFENARVRAVNRF